MTLELQDLVLASIEKNASRPSREQQTIIYGPHVRRCVCPICHTIFLHQHRAWQIEHDAYLQSLTPEQLAQRDALADEILAQVLAEPKTPHRTQSAVVQVGTRVRYHSESASPREQRCGVVVEMPGPSDLYGGRPAERIRVLLDATADWEAETVWTDNTHWSWLELE